MFTLERVAEVDSTSSELMRRAEAGVAPGIALLARRQTGGRGRLGRRWESIEGNLFLSALLGIEDIRQAGHWSLLVGVALAEAIEGMAPGLGHRLKWPNDILVDGRKLAGILIEAAPGGAHNQGSPSSLEDTSSADLIRGSLGRVGAGRGSETNGSGPWMTSDLSVRLVVGYGVNVVAAPAGLGRPVVSLAEMGIPATADTLADAVLARLGAWARRYVAEGFAPVRAAWLAAGHRPGEALSVQHGAARVDGRFAGLAADGALLLDTGGRTMTIVAGEVLA
jgi:BirA family biotin operon repressor/biotin-[acetyl-CoA-carboxylase] ligase